MSEKAKTFLIWAVLISAAAVGFIGEFEIPMGWYVAALGIALLFVDGTYRDKISDLEYRLDGLNDRLNELDGFVDEKFNGQG